MKSVGNQRKTFVEDVAPYFKCVVTKIGYMNEDGDINTERLREMYIKAKESQANANVEKFIK